MDTPKKPKPPKFVTRKELAKRLGVKIGTLNVRIWMAIPPIEPTSVVRVDGQWVHHYDAAAVTRILALFAKKGSTNA